MSGEIVEESSRPLQSQRLSRSPLGAKEKLAALPLLSILRHVWRNCRRVVVLLSQRFARSPLVLRLYNS